MLLDALKDLRAEIIAGQSLAEIAAEIAAEYGINPALLVRKFTESYGSETALRATAAATAPATVFADKTTRTIAAFCAHYSVSESATREITFGGETYTRIGRISKKAVLAVRHSDGRAYRLPL